MDKIILEKDVLERLYLKELFSIRDIARQLDVNNMIVRKYLYLYNIPRRDRSWKSLSKRNGREVPCATCGKMIYRKKYRLEKFSIFFCSWKCEKEHQSITRRISDLPESWRRRRGYKTWRKKVLERDGYACKICKSSGRLVAHHIIEAKDNPNIRFELDNGITLCDKCHIKIHQNNSINYIKPLQEAILVENSNIGENLVIGNPEAIG